MRIDWWTLGFQAINVVILVWLLQHFFWRPIAAMIEQRRSQTQKALAEATAAQTKADAGMAEILSIRAGFAQERDAILSAAHADAETASKALLDAAGKTAAEQTASAAAATLAAHDTADADWADQASQLAVQIARRLAARLAGPAVNTAFLDWLVASIQAMPVQARQAAAQDDGLEAVSAETLDGGQEENARALIAAAFGAEPSMTFRTDPALIAGIELHGRHFSLTNSWRADLEQILRDIRHAP